MDSIRVNSDVKKIEVNDKGEYICIPLNDQTFVNRLLELSELISSDDIKKKFENDGTLTDAELIARSNEVNVSLINKIEDIFGAGSCKKIFSDIYENNNDAVPGLLVITDFIEQILPLMEKYANDLKNNDKLNKYLGQIHR